MDRNVLMVNIFDEAQCQQRQSPGGFCPLGEQTYSDLTSSTALSATEWIGDLNQGRSNTGNFCIRNYMGYHGANRDGGGGGDGCDGSYGQSPPFGIPVDWNEWSTTSPIDCQCGENRPRFNARVQQPTRHYIYSEDLFTKIYPFYNSFRGFVYPALATENASTSAFALHMYGAINGTTVGLSSFVDNPTVVAMGGTLSAVTQTNPYSTLTDLTYGRGGSTVDLWYEPSSTTEPFDPWMMGPTKAMNYTGTWNAGSDWYYTAYGTQIDSGADQNGPILQGLKNYGWDFNPTVGCISPPCDLSDIFSGGTFAADLNAFLTGSSYSIQTVISGCTECQCLPAVFLNNKGPIKVEEPPITGCLCLPETDPPVYSPECCPEPPVTIASLCGPHPQSSTEELPRQAPQLVSETGSKLRITNIQQSKEVPSPKSPLYSGRLLPTANIKSLEPALGASSLSKLYSTKYSIDIRVSLQQFLIEDNKVGFDVTLESLSQFGNNLIDSNGAFYWVIEPGVKRDPTTNRNITRACVPLNKSKIRSTSSQSRGGRISFLRAHCNIKGDAANNFISYSSKSETTYIFCIGLGVVVNNKMFFKTKRIMIKGNENYGWGLTPLT